VLLAELLQAFNYIVRHRTGRLSGVARRGGVWSPSVSQPADYRRAFYVMYNNRRVNERRNARIVRAYGCAR
jgi:hypothetical protein